MQKMVFRCPTCSKLYESDVKSIKSTSPHFDCLVCGDTFSFQFPVKDLNQIQTFSVGKGGPASQRLTKECPKCGALNQNAATECYSCQIVFRQYELLKNETYPQAVPSLVALWKEFLNDFENFEKRQKWLESCRNLKQLDYAETKLHSLKRVLGDSLICDEALKQVSEMKKADLIAVITPSATISKGGFKKWQFFLKDILLQRRNLFLGPVLFSLILIMVGLLQAQHRNMVGLAVALLMLHFGLILTIRGKISLSDFIKK